MPVLLGADLTRVSVFTAVPALGFTDWPAVVLEPPPDPLPPVDPAFWLAEVFWFVAPLALTFVLVLFGAPD